MKNEKTTEEIALGIRRRVFEYAIRNNGGRFAFSKAECHEIVGACRDESGISPAILPSPCGGMTIDRLPDMAAGYGQDCVYLLGGSLLRYGDDIGDAIRKMRTALSY